MAQPFDEHARLLRAFASSREKIRSTRSPRSREEARYNPAPPKPPAPLRRQAPISQALHGVRGQEMDACLRRQAVGEKWQLDRDVRYRFDTNKPCRSAKDPIADITLGPYIAGMENGTQAIFKGPAGSLSISVERYQFPEIINDEWDSNWLIIAGNAELDGKSWTFRDPCLTTFELEHLANWLDQVFLSKAESAYCGFTEPNLDFERLSEQEVRIAFSLEALPPGCERDGDFGEIGFNIPINDQLPAAAKSLRALLDHFPVRARSSS